MSLPAATGQSTYPTEKPAPYDNTSCDTQPTLCSPPQHHFELGPPQRRRVNPESLAARLGPELVAEMEKHIIPGSIEMPPFSVRRDIQIKFGIDRRHIYDFFHSRGLRCLNEKAMRTSFLETKSQRPARIVATPPALLEPRKRRAAVAALEATSLKRTHAPRKQKGKPKRPERQPCSPAGSDNVSPPEASSSVILDPDLDVDSAMTDVAQELFPSSDASLLMSDDSDIHFLGQFSAFSSDEKEVESDLPPCYSVSSLLNLSPSVSSFTLSTSSSMSSTLSFSSESSVREITDVRPRVLPLSPQERKAHYAWLDGIIGPASGIQECVGTYKAFMEQQREAYYDRLLFLAEQPTKMVRRAANEFISRLGNPPTSRIPAHESPPPPLVVPTPRLSRPAITHSGPSLPSERTDTGACRHSKPQGVVPAVSVPQLSLSARLPCPVPDWTRHSRRRTLSASVDM